MNLKNKMLLSFFLFSINVAISEEKKPLLDEFTDQVTGFEKKSDDYEVTFRKRAARYHLKDKKLVDKFQDFLTTKKKIKIKADMTQMEILDGNLL